MEDRQLAFLMLASGLLGASVGFALHALAFRPPPEERERIVTEVKEVPVELTDEQLESVCAVLRQSDRDRLENAQDEVTRLREVLAGREDELTDLRKQARRGAEVGAELRSKIAKLETEVAELQADLQDVVQERDKLLVDLKTTVKALENQIKETEKYKKVAKHWKRKSTENAWRSFVAETKNTMCDRGTRKRHEKCHEAVEAAMGPVVQDRFEECVDAYQSVPVLAQKSPGEDLPPFSEEIENDPAFTQKNFFITFCDPTLPEMGLTDIP